MPQGRPCLGGSFGQLADQEQPSDVPARVRLTDGKDHGVPMTGNALQQRARDRVEELPGAVLEHPFGPEWEVFKVRGKVFMLISDVTGESIVIIKADPEDAK